ncbi:MAG: hypothetical protein M3082_11610 [Candidatus Dormibacteraeota bacterium]|nr:hypothetical protein [Candidatus Dormibacteraeota bacterium]
MTGTVTATTSFKLEAISCSATNQGMAPGLAILNSTYGVAGGYIIESCATGTPVYSAVAVLNNARGLPITVTVGDKISITVAVSSTATTVEVSDVTTHMARTRTGAGATPSALYVGINALSWAGTLMAVPTFLTERFNSTTVNGAALSTTTPAAIDRTTSGAVIEIKTGKLNSVGTGFTEAFKSH